jgi:hypothetical protein
MDYKPSDERDNPIDPERCKAAVHAMGWRWVQCSRKGRYGGYCKQHNPDEIAKREQAKEAEYQRKRKARSRPFVRGGYYLKIRDVMDDPGLDPEATLDAIRNLIIDCDKETA